MTMNNDIVTCTYCGNVFSEAEAESCPVCYTCDGCGNVVNSEEVLHDSGCKNKRGSVG